MMFYLTTNSLKSKKAREGKAFRAKRNTSDRRPDIMMLGPHHHYWFLKKQLQTFFFTLSFSFVSFTFRLLASIFSIFANEVFIIEWYFVTTRPQEKLSAWLPMNCAWENAEFSAISVILAKIPVIGCHFCRNFHHFLIKGSTFPEAWFNSIGGF